jgi:hypothetical protein
MKEKKIQRNCDLHNNYDSAKKKKKKKNKLLIKRNVSI